MIYDRRNSIEPSDIKKSYNKKRKKNKKRKNKRKKEKQNDLEKENMMNDVDIEDEKKESKKIRTDNSIKRIINIERKKQIFKEKIEEIREMKRIEKEKKDKKRKDRIIFGFKLVGSVLGAVISVVIF